MILSCVFVRRVTSYLRSWSWFDFEDTLKQRRGSGFHDAAKLKLFETQPIFANVTLEPNAVVISSLDGANGGPRDILECVAEKRTIHPSRFDKFYPSFFFLLLHALECLGRTMGEKQTNLPSLNDVLANKNWRVKGQTQSILFRLPPEIRREVYVYALAGLVNVDKPRGNGTNPLSLLRSCGKM